MAKTGGDQGAEIIHLSVRWNLLLQSLPRVARALDELDRFDHGKLLTGELRSAEVLAVSQRNPSFMPVILIEKPNPKITIVTLNRPERRNALTLELMNELISAIAVASDQAGERVLILRGAGSAFCAGLDLKAATPQNAQATAEMVAKVLVALSQSRLITIAAVHGAAVAGGAGIMSACDYVVAAERTKIGYPEVRRGLVAGLVLTFLRRQVRERDIRELLFAGEIIEAQRAREIGLVNRVVPASDVMNEAQKFADAVLQGAPNAMVQTKRLIEELWSTSVKEDVELALKYHMQARESAEAREGIAAFNEKRPPKWAV
jgi:methylglutaconyl-CoA hydratase